MQLLPHHFLAALDDLRNAASETGRRAKEDLLEIRKIVIKDIAKPTYGVGRIHHKVRRENCQTCYRVRSSELLPQTSGDFGQPAGLHDRSA